jgi:hypothetical protein
MMGDDHFARARLELIEEFDFGFDEASHGEQVSLDFADGGECFEVDFWLVSYVHRCALPILAIVPVGSHTVWTHNLFALYSVCVMECAAMGICNE